MSLIVTHDDWVILVINNVSSLDTSGQLMLSDFQFHITAERKLSETWVLVENPNCSSYFNLFEDD